MTITQDARCECLLVAAALVCLVGYSQAAIAQDTLGNVLTDFNSKVTLAIGTNAGGGTLSGGTTVAASGGLAVFDSLRINKPGVGYTLTATTTASGVAAATSSPFTIF